MKLKRRLDELLLDKGLALTLEEAQGLIMSGKVFDDKGRRLDKRGEKIDETAVVMVKDNKGQYASRAGDKLAHALKTYSIEVEGKVFLDVGSSTGGFTDCLVQNKARHVFAVDVGYGLIDSKLRGNPAVSVVERINARHLKRSDLLEHSPLAENIEMLVMDVSFISIEKLIGPLKAEFPEIRYWVLLFKPQFEVDKKDVLDGGIIRNQEVLSAAQSRFEAFMDGLGFTLIQPPSSSPIAGKKSGNVEYLYYYEKRP